MTGSLTLAPLTPLTTSTLTLFMNIGVNVVQTILALEIPTSFSGVPSCRYMNKGGTLQPIDCKWSLGFLNLTIAQIDGTACVAGTTCPRLVVSDLITPQVGGAYPVRAFIQTSSTLYTLNTTFNIPIPQFETGSSVQAVSNLISQQTMINFNLKLKYDVPAGVKNLPDPYVSFSLIEIRFMQQNLGADTFTEDLGSGKNDLSDLGCGF